MLVALISIDEPGGLQYHGGDVAAPAFSAIVSRVLLHLGVRPDLPEEVESEVEGVERLQRARGTEQVPAGGLRMASRRTPLAEAVEAVEAAADVEPAKGPETGPQG